MQYRQGARDGLSSGFANLDLTSTNVHGRDIRLMAAGGDIYVNSESREYRSETAQERNTVLRWISRTNFKAIQRDIFSKVAKNTGLWFLNDERFLKWKAAKRPLLWGVGIAGAGKTFLSSVVVNHLQRASRNDTSQLVIFAYCRFEEAYGELDILKALLRQIAEVSTPVYDSLKALFRENIDDDGEAILSRDDVFEALKVGFQQFTRTFVIIDGLDELTDDAWFNLVNDLRGELSDSSVSVLLTSRNIRLVPGLKPDLYIRPNVLELNTFIRMELRRLPKLAESLDTHALDMKVAGKIENKCEGMFLLARLQIDALRNVKTVKELLYEIEQMPTGVSQMYKTTLARIKEQPKDDRELAYRALVWVAHSRRPLTSRELRFALAATPNCTNLDSDNLISESTLLAICYGLLSVEGEDNVARLSHYTAHSFLVSLNEPPFSTPHWEMAGCCISYLSAFTERGTIWPQDRDSLAEKQRNCDFWSYSNGLLGLHLHFATVLHPEHSLPHHFLLFFENSTSMPLQSREITGNEDAAGCDWGSSVHFAAKHGILPLIQVSSHSLSAESRLGITPLMYAAGFGSIRLTSRLLLAGVDVNQSGRHRSSTALSRAIMNGHVEVVKLLLSRPNINVNTQYGGVGILYAVIRDGPQDMKTLHLIVSLLVEQPALNIARLDNGSRTILHCAAERGVSAEIFQLLIKRASSLVNATDDRGRTALDLAEAILDKNRRGEISLILRMAGGRKGVPIGPHWHSLATAPIGHLPPHSSDTRVVRSLAVSPR